MEYVPVIVGLAIFGTVVYVGYRLISEDLKNDDEGN